MEPHPLADLIPPMGDEDYAKLRDDIKENGLLEPITLYEGRILDGRHRYRACQELDIDCPTKDYDGDDPARYVVSLNVNRRHLTVTERAEIALAVVPHFREQAKERQGERVDLTSGPTEPEVPDEPKRAIGQAAAAVGVSRVTVQRLQRIKRDAPELHVKVQTGELSIRAADDVLRDQRPSPKRRDITQPYEINSNKARIDADAAKRRLEAVLAALSGHSYGLKGFDTRKAMATMTTDELQGWVRTLSEAMRTFRALRTVMKAETENPSKLSPSPGQ